jgi:hypothetical protein
MKVWRTGPKTGSSGPVVRGAGLEPKVVDRVFTTSTFDGNSLG